MLLKKWLDFWKDNYIGNDNRERFYWLSYGAVAYVVFVAIGTVLPHNFSFQTSKESLSSFTLSYLVVAMNFFCFVIDFAFSSDYIP